MDEYITQLVEMIREAHHNKPEPRKLSFDEEMEEMENLFSDQNPTMAFHFGIPVEYFPPVEKLEPKHFDILVPELLDLWLTFNYHPSFPKKLPNELRYKKMREELEKPHPLLKGTNGIWGIEFCHYDPKECPFPFEYCGCKEFYLDELN